MKKLGKWLILIGIVIMLIPIIGRIYVSYKQEELYKGYKQSLQVQDEEKIVQTSLSSTQLTIEKKEDTGDTAKEEINEDENWQCPDTVEEGEVLGRIMISKINIDMLLSEGTQNEQLAVGAGHMVETALPGQEGNCVIAGHRNYIFGSMFNRLDEVEIGDAVDVELKGKTFSYTVTKTMIIKPNDLTVLEQDQEQRELTLITCHPVYSSAYRLIIKAELNEE